jgi:hypothetical protein
VKKECVEEELCSEKEVGLEDLEYSEPIHVAKIEKMVLERVPGAWSGRSCCSQETVDEGSGW